MAKFSLSSITFLQRIHSTVDEKEQKQLLMDLEVVMKSSECPYIVKFYGALFTEVCLNSELGHSFSNKSEV